MVDIAAPWLCTGAKRARVAEVRPQVWVALELDGGFGASIVLPPFVACWDVSADKQNVTVPFCLVEGQASQTPWSDVRS